MNRRRLAFGALAGALLALVGTSLEAQLPEHLRDYPLGPIKASGGLIAPFLDGWIDNGDGSVTMVFGFMNRNTEENVDIPLGPNNYIEPAQFDGVQPTHFPIYAPRGLRERGAFAVTVPANMAGTEIVWTLAHAGHSYSLPGRATSTAYEMSSTPRAEGSLNPAIRFGLNGPESSGREGAMGSRVTASAGTPVTLSAYIQDRGERDQYEVGPFYALGTEWIKHQGPVGAVPEFEQASIMGRQRARAAGEDAASDSNAWSEVTTQATFPEPGDYVVRLRVDNFTAPDSQFDNQCCWSNAYVPVTVTP